MRISNHKLSSAEMGGTSAESAVGSASGISESGQEKTAVSFGRIVAEVYTYFVQPFKDFIFRKRLLLLALMAHRMHRKR